MLPFDHWKADPPGRQCGAELAMRKERNVATHRAQFRDDPVGTGGHFGGGLAVGAAVAPDVPVWILLAYIHRPPSFIVAVVPFSQIRFDLARRRESCELAGLARAQPRADADTVAPSLGQTWRKSACFIFAVRGQPEVGAPGVLAGERPRGLAVPNEMGSQELGQAVSIPAW